MHHKRTTAQQVLTLLKIGSQAQRAGKQLEKEFGHYCGKSAASAAELLIKVMGV